MSRQRACDALNGKPTDRIPQWDFPDNPALAETLLPYDIWEDTARTSADLFKHFDIDMTHYLPGGIAEWNFPLVRYFDEADYGEGGDTAPYRRAYRRDTPKPYRSMYDALGMGCRASFWGMAPTLVMQQYPVDSPESVLRFNPAEHDAATFESRRAFFETYYRDTQALLGDSCLLLGWYYHTLFMWPVELFGWEHFMVAAMLDPDRFRAILDQFYALTRRDLAAMAAVPGLPAIGCHDDLCNAAGPMFPPDWYRANVYDRYAELIALLHDAGKQAIFVCDGNVVPLLDDLAALGFDGIAVDGHADLRRVVEAFSGRIIVGGMPAAVVSQGTPEAIEQMVKETAGIVRGEPRYFFQCCGMAGRTPPENVKHYQACLRKYGRRVA
ncbi:MAG: hypothetical protein JW951_02790 [Lentisphaerae bacterium]|nr:hypothetical protein [Lentisphaerota bacterium]